MGEFKSTRKRKPNKESEVEKKVEIEEEKEKKVEKENNEKDGEKKKETQTEDKLDNEPNKDENKRNMSFGDFAISEIDNLGKIIAVITPLATVMVIIWIYIMEFAKLRTYNINDSYIHIDVISVLSGVSIALILIAIVIFIMAFSYLITRSYRQKFKEKFNNKDMYLHKKIIEFLMYIIVVFTTYYITLDYNYIYVSAICLTCYIGFMYFNSFLNIINAGSNNKKLIIFEIIYIALINFVVATLYDRSISNIIIVMALLFEFLFYFFNYLYSCFCMDRKVEISIIEISKELFKELCKEVFAPVFISVIIVKLIDLCIHLVDSFEINLIWKVTFFVSLIVIYMLLINKFTSSGKDNDKSMKDKGDFREFAILWCISTICSGGILIVACVIPETLKEIFSLQSSYNMVEILTLGIDGGGYYYEDSDKIFSTLIWYKIAFYISCFLLIFFTILEFGFKAERVSENFPIKLNAKLILPKVGIVISVLFILISRILYCSSFIKVNTYFDTITLEQGISKINPNCDKTNITEDGFVILYRYDDDVFIAPYFVKETENKKNGDVEIDINKVAMVEFNGLNPKNTIFNSVKFSKPDIDRRVTEITLEDETLE